MTIRKKNKKPTPPLVAQKLTRHFGKQPLEQLVTASRSFPVASRIDLQAALDKIFREQFGAELVGVHRRFAHDTMTVSELLTTDNYAALIAPLQHLEIDIGEVVPARCLNHGCGFPLLAHFALLSC